MKFPDWHDRLIALIERRKAMPFAWGRNDCCLWPADAVFATTGRDPAADLRGHYSTARGAACVLRRIGGLEGAMSRGGQSIPPLMAQTGDVGIVSGTGERIAGAVCIGDLWLALTETGIGPMPFECVRKAWRVA